MLITFRCPTCGRTYRMIHADGFFHCVGAAPKILDCLGCLLALFEAMDVAVAVDTGHDGSSRAYGLN